MKDSLSIPPSRGFFPYAYREEIRDRGRCLRQLLDFINYGGDKYEVSWAKLAAFLFGEEIVEVKRSRGEVLEVLMAAFTRRKMRWLREELRRTVKTLLKESGKGRGYQVVKTALGVKRRALADGSMIYHAWPMAGMGLPPRKPVQWALGQASAHIWWSMSWLRSEAVKNCGQCGGYFVRPSGHEIKYCSDACRGIAFGPRRRRKGRRGNGKVKRGK